MKRKIIKQGNGTLTMTLPRQWAREVGLSGESEIEIVVDENHLIVSPVGEINKKEITINVDNFQRLAFAKFLIACYEQGVDTMDLRFSKKTSKSWSHGHEDVADVIQFFTNRLVGFEVLSQTKNSIKIGNISEKHVKFENIVSRIFFLLEEYVDHLADALSTNDHAILKDGENRHDNIAKLVALSLRMIHESKTISNVNALNMHTVLHTVDKVADFFRYTYRYAMPHKRKVSKTTIRLVKKVRDFIEQYRHFFNKFSYDEIGTLDSLRGEVKGLFLLQMKKHPSEGTITYSLNAAVETLHGAIKPRISIELDKNKFV